MKTLKLNNYGIIYLLLFLFLFSFDLPVIAAEKSKKVKVEKGPVVSTVLKGVQGEVTWIGRGMIAVTYSRNIEGGSEEETRAEVRRCFQAAGAHGSYTTMSLGECS